MTELEKKAIAYVAEFYALDEDTVIKFFMDEVEALIKLDLTTIKQDLRVQEQDPQKNALDKLVHINERFGLYD